MFSQQNHLQNGKEQLLNASESFYFHMTVHAYKTLTFREPKDFKMVYHYDDRTRAAQLCRRVKGVVH